jgi:hypothetical protein
VVRKQRQYWFTVNTGNLITMDKVVMNINYEFDISVKKWGSGKYVTIEADFFVKSPHKRTSIKKFLAKHFPQVAFRSYPVVK